MVKKNLGYFIFLLSFLGVLAIDIHLPAIPLIINEFHATKLQAQCIFLFPLLIAIFARLLAGPIIPKIGRKRFLLIGYGIALISQALCTFAPNIHTLLIFRIPAGIAGAMVGVSVSLLVAELFEGESRARMQGLVEIGFSAAITVAPIFGAFLSDFFGWRACFAFLFFAFLSNAVFIFNAFPESPITQKNETTISIAYYFMDYKRLLSNKKFFILLTTPGLFLGAHLIFAINSPFIYIMQFGMSSKMFAVYQSMPIIINLLFLFIYRRVIIKIGINRAILFGITGYGIFIVFLSCILIRIIPPIPNTLLAAMCIQCASTSFLISSFSSQLFDIVPQDKNCVASLLATFRPLSISICLTIVSIMWAKGSEHSLLYYFFAVALLAFLFSLVSKKIVSETT